MSKMIIKAITQTKSGSIITLSDSNGVIQTITIKWKQVDSGGYDYNATVSPESGTVAELSKLSESGTVIEFSDHADTIPSIFRKIFRKIVI